MNKLALIVFGWVVLGMNAQGASFECGKAQTKVEHLICDNAELSKLDDELAVSYKAALHDKTQADAIKKAQKQWMKDARNVCADVGCLKTAYQARIHELTGALAQAGIAQKVAQQKISGVELSNKESYTLVMSKDDELCNHMLQEFNEDLENYGWSGDAHQEEHEEFKRIPWQPARFSYDYNGNLLHSSVEGALFDFNNDGVQDFVVRDKSSLSGMRADLIFMLDSSVAKRANDLTATELGGDKDSISLAGHGYWSSTLPGVVVDSRVLEPFIFHGTSYLVMREVFEEIRTIGGYAVITKYGGGELVERKMTGKMEDICYFKRIGAKRKN
ncbi:MAG: lysozyme inhibitor LprI family protein [Gallionellaceae bacterium]